MNGKLNSKMVTVWAFFTKSGHFFSIFKIGQARPPPLSPYSCVPGVQGVIHAMQRHHTITSPQYLLYCLFKPKPAGIYQFKVNKGNTGTISKFCSKLTIKTPDQRHRRRPGVSIVPSRILVPLNQYGSPNIESKFFRARFVKRPGQTKKCI